MTIQDNTMEHGAYVGFDVTADEAQVGNTSKTAQE